MNSYFELPTISCGDKNLALVNGIESQELGIEPKYSSKLVTLSIRIALEGDSISPITMLSEPRSEMVATEARHFHSPLWLLRDILSIEKMNGQLVFKGMAADVVTENIFYCEESDSVFMSTEKTFDSPITGKPAKIIGWVESSDMNKSKEIDKILASFKKTRLALPETQTIAKQANVEGGNEMSDVQNDVVVEAVEAETIIEKSVDVVEEVAAVEAIAETTEDTTPADSVEETVEKTADPDFAKMLGDLKGFFSETLAKATDANAAQVSEIKETVESFSKSVNGQIAELAEKHNALSTAVLEIKGTIDGVQKRVDAVEGDTAIKKSSDLGRSEVVTKKSTWNGSFLGSVNEIFSN